MKSKKHSMALIVPYRNRFEHLKQFLPYMHEFLAGTDYHIYVIEQADTHPFNRGQLLNVGFLESENDHDYFVFHDVDLLPEGDSSLYEHSKIPTHLSAEVEQFNYKLPYETIFGGVSMVTSDVFRKVNGFTNHFWGWGAEDDDIRMKMHLAGIAVDRRQGRYRSLPHKPNEENRGNNNAKYWSSVRQKTLGTYPGLNEMRYKVLARFPTEKHTLIRVELQR